MKEIENNEKKCIQKLVNPSDKNILKHVYFNPSKPKTPPGERANSPMCNNIRINKNKPTIDFKKREQKSIKFINVSPNNRNLNNLYPSKSKENQEVLLEKRIIAKKNITKISRIKSSSYSEK